MRSLRIPLGVSDWRGSTLVLLIVLAPLLASLTFVPVDEALSDAMGSRSLLVGTATLAAAVFLYLHWRLSASRACGWLALLLCVAGLPSLALGGLALTRPEVIEAQATWLVVSRIVLAGGLIGTALLARRATLRVDPLAAGLLAGLVVTAARHVLLTSAPSLPESPALHTVRTIALCLLIVALGVVIARIDGLPRWVLARVAAGMLLLGLGAPLTGPPALLTAVVGAVLLAGTAAALMHQALDRENARVAELHARLSAVELGSRADRARLHEIDATVAGIASAQQLLQNPRLAAGRNEALAAMMYAEVERLQRLLAQRAPARQRTVDLDDVIGQIVLSHGARGRAVAWEPTGRYALGRADDVAEVVNVLLENAAVHGRGERVAVAVDPDPDGSGVTVTVSDRGPGVPLELREQVFAWGRSRPGSPGQGIGLHVAAELAEEMGGRLELLPSLRGAVFALHLPTESAVPAGAARPVMPHEGVVAREHGRRAS